MQRYETLILATPEITNDEARELEKSIDRKVQEHKGAIISHDRWGKYLLAYPVKGHDYGVYFLTRFEVPFGKKEEAVKEVKSLFDLKFNTLVLRYVTSYLSNTAPLEYKRPLSLDEKPRDMSLFNREHSHEQRGRRNEGEAAPAELKESAATIDVEEKLAE